MSDELSKNQKLYYDKKVEFFSNLRVQGQRIAIPYGLIRDEVMSMTDEECSRLLMLETSNPENN